MKPKKLRVPAPVHHRPSGQDVVFLRDAEGRRRMIYLGEHGSTQAARRYREVLAEHLAGKPVTTATRRQGEASAWPTVAQLCAAFLLDAERYYVDAAGRRSREVDNFRLALRALLHLHRDTPTDRFTINDLIEVRQALIDGEYGYQAGKSGRREGVGGRKRSRTYINATVRRIKQVFRWGTERRMVPGLAWHELSALRSLPIGRCAARETEPVEAVPWSMVEPVLEHLPGPLAACVRLQWCTGMRPSEALQIRMGDIDRSGDVWLYTIKNHKNIWRGQQRIVALGPEAQAILKPLLRVDGGFLISPRDAAAEQKAEKRAARQTPLTPSQRARDERNAAKEPAVGDHYGLDAYRKAIHRACDQAGIARWSPHRLRHAKGTELARTEGIEVARIALGHKDDRVTRRYTVGAELDLAISIARRNG
ncbi:MAG: tyrosine-type recombinase/integrase [Planctomycetes bacterium]|nr:tyrosine-type recombinase/integrase [Planctomycetota bacterium]